MHGTPLDFKVYFFNKRRTFILNDSFGSLKSKRDIFAVSHRNQIHELGKHHLLKR